MKFPRSMPAKYQVGGKRIISSDLEVVVLS